MIINNFKELKEILNENISVAAHSDNAKIVYVEGNKIVLPMEV